MYWKVARDLMSVKPLVNLPVKLTKRSLLSVMNSVFDPLGVCAPVTLAVRIAVRDCMATKRVWDEEFEPDVSEHVTKSIGLLNEQGDIWMPRCVAPNFGNTCLVMFSDASAKAMGAAIYAISNGFANLVTSRSCLAPLRTTPDLELHAAWIGSELLRRVVRWTGIERVACFSDSEIVLQWINKPLHDLKSIYVANRVRKIIQIVQPNAWNHVSSGHNPADLLTRGCSARRLKDNNLWWNGPDWLRSWSQFHSLMPSPMGKPMVNFVKRLAPDPESWEQIWSNEVARFPVDTEPRMVLLSVWKREQTELFARELDALKSDQIVPAGSRVKRYVPFIDVDGVMRVRGRTQTGNLDFDSPVILYARGRRARAWLRWQHVRLGHCGVGPLMHHAREKFLFIDLRTVCRNVVASCQTCVERRGRLIEVPQGLLPRERTTGGSAFRFIGIDFLGPFNLNSSVKRWVLLSTCMTSRAVHLEVVRNVSTADVWHSLVMLFSRRGVPEVIYSDNGTSFARASKDIGAFLEAVREAFVNLALPPTITWKFNTPVAPWQGGFFERLVGHVKACLPDLTRIKSPTDDEFRLWVTCAEAIVNSRPIGFNDDGDVLTPGHLAIGRKPLAWPPLDYLPENLQSSVRVLMSERNEAMDKFWRSWHRSYLASLPGRFRDPKSSPPVEIGSNVLVADKNLSWNKWKMGIVQSLMPGADGISRSAVVRIDDVDYERPIQLLSLLECEDVAPNAM